MSGNVKYWLFWVISIAGLALELFGIQRVYEMRAVDAMSIELIFGGALLGVPATLMRYYFRARSRQHKDQQQIAVETLSRMVSAGDEAARHNGHPDQATGYRPDSTSKKSAV